LDFAGVNDVAVATELINDGLNLVLGDLGKIEFGSGGDVTLEVLLKEGNDVEGFLSLLE